MQVADGDGQRIRTGFGDEAGRFFDVGEDVRRRRVARALASGSGVAHAPQLGFDIDACGMGEPCDEAGSGDIFFQRQAGTVEHHRTEARADGADAGFGALPWSRCTATGIFASRAACRKTGAISSMGAPGNCTSASCRMTGARNSSAAAMAPMTFSTLRQLNAPTA